MEWRKESKRGGGGLVVMNRGQWRIGRCER